MPTTEHKTTGPFPFDGPVARDENRAAHGGVTYRDTRADGTYRLRNVNGSHEEIGPWTLPFSAVELPTDRAMLAKTCRRLLPSILVTERVGLRVEPLRSQVLDADAADVTLTVGKRSIGIYWDATDPRNAGWCVALTDGGRQAVDTEADIIALGQLL